MTKKGKGSPTIQYIYRGDEDEDRLPYEGPGIRTNAQGDNRGKRAAEGSGVVVGSGAGAGGGGNDEDLDQDSAGGGGRVRMPTSPKSTPVSDAQEAEDPLARPRE